MGAIADVFNFGDWNRMRMWLLAIAVAALGLQGLSITGHANLNDTIFLNSQWSWLSGIVGGVLFGAGMVLASGCGSKTLIRLGAGNLKALMVFVIMGITAYMTLKGVFGVFRANYLDPIRFEFSGSPYLPELLANLFSQEPATLISIFAIALPVILLILALGSKSAWNREVIVGGAGVGLTIVAAWWVVFQVAYIPEHPDTLEAAYLAGLLDDLIGAKFNPISTEKGVAAEGQKGSFSSPFEEPFVYERSGDNDNNPDATPIPAPEKCMGIGENGKLRCKPAAGTISLLPNGDFLYFNALEGTEDFEFSILVDFGQKAINDQTRRMIIPKDATSATNWIRPLEVDSGANPDGYEITELLP
eukprot:gene9115-8926_t